ncbi:MAG: hypothetical protein ACSI46_12555 [Gloeotrichia echinulata DVL01]|jgi:hypothetical protein
MTTWIVTTGNSDIILEHDKNWGSLYSEVRYDLECTEFSSPLPIDLKDKSAGYTIPARVLGLVYGNQPDYYSDLKFPLLDTYHQYFEAEKIKPERIIILLTDQTKIFQQDQMLYERCPYWQDTCTLKPLLERYFKKEFQDKFNYQPEIVYLTLTPTNPDKGIDNWEETLYLVEATLRQLDDNSLKKVYISHQAGTPATSSALQFVSLGRFQDVKFLISNEYFDENYQQQSKSEAIESSNYWRGMQIQKAKALLKRFDYSGVKDLFSNLWKNQEEALNPQDQQIINLLNMAIQWNSAKFKNFGQARGKKAQQRLQNWWWPGYEAAYLAVVRLEQDNTVEALFHSFRAVEGLIRAKAGQTNEPLHELIPKIFPDWKLNPDMKVFNDNTRKKRNILFHQLLGIEKKEVFKAWDTNNNSEWQNRVLGCLNSVSDKEFKSLEEASLMFDVHQELEAAINNYELKNS